MVLVGIELETLVSESDALTTRPPPIIVMYYTDVERRPDGRLADNPDFWRGRLGSIPELVKLTQVAIDLTPLQSCTVCLSASCGDEFLITRYTVVDTKTSIIKKKMIIKLYVLIQIKEIMEE